MSQTKSKTNAVLDVRDVPSLGKWLTLSIQHLFAMFGATVLVPILVDLSPGVALISSGLGTLAYLLITKGRIPAYLGSSFAFIAPIILAKSIGGPEAAMIGSFLAGIIYGIIALFISKFGINWLMKILPPVVVGPVIIVIGLGLAGTAVNMAMYENPGAPVNELVYSSTHFMVALATLAITIISAIFLRGFLSLIPVLVGIVAGYIIAYFAGIVDLSIVKNAQLFEIPDFVVPFVHYTPSFSWEVALIMVPVAIVTLAEHIGDQMVLSKVVGKNFIQNPGLHRSILGDGVATIIASFIGGPPNTTYGENIGVLAITRVFSVFVIGGAAVIAILFGFIGKITALISTIPSAVMGGVSILLFGIIASSGLRMLIDNNVDLGIKRNLIISSVILVIGVGGAFIQIGERLSLSGMALAAIVGIILNLILPGRKDGFGTENIFEKPEQDNNKTIA
ncbi:uracil permease [Bacillus aquiflavi]|uniref:Uracil permease n=1 Tax=Bacillus aquiflavi TaxID=2672567 RepID=A0A6B3W1J2_9BACI|nr:solute carrier family 23 protein [Bacillus aquiflavi]MBA4537586.1 uracil permease [Bacillus aquiflavi]NEY81843.1 uracil permease [Bacillus aquiflavi]UAC49325.1 NCS2 family nucleobase:cation symporter [Bacillus aquiflavi]